MVYSNFRKMAVIGRYMSHNIFNKIETYPNVYSDSSNTRKRDGVYQMKSFLNELNGFFRFSEGHAGGSHNSEATTSLPRLSYTL